MVLRMSCTCTRRGLNLTSLYLSLLLYIITRQYTEERACCVFVSLHQVNAWGILCTKYIATGQHNRDTSTEFKRKARMKYCVSFARLSHDYQCQSIFHCCRLHLKPCVFLCYGILRRDSNPEDQVRKLQVLKTGGGSYIVCLNPVTGTIRWICPPQILVSELTLDVIQSVARKAQI